MNVKVEIREIVAKVLNVELSMIANDTDLEVDLGADSIDLIDLTWHLERRFDIDIPEKWLDSLISVNAIADIIAPILEAVHGIKT